MVTYRVGEWNGMKWKLKTKLKKKLEKKDMKTPHNSCLMSPFTVKTAASRRADSADVRRLFSQAKFDQTKNTSKSWTVQWNSLDENFLMVVFTLLRFEQKNMAVKGLKRLGNLCYP